MKFVFARDRVVASVTGRTVEFPKGVPTHCPPAMHAEVIAAGGVPEEELEDETPKKVELSAEDRTALIRAAIEDMVAANERDDFTAAGVPVTQVVSGRCGFTVTKAEIAAIWKQVGEAK